jgi:Flp pilus assembly pilin Flp
MGDEEKNKKVRIEMIEKLSALITAAFGLVAALAWNSAIQNIFNLFFKDNSGVSAQIIYAVIVTVIAVYVTFLLGRAKSSLVEKLDKKK